MAQVPLLNMNIDPKLDAEIRDLWQRRPELDESEWVRLYEIVTAALANYKPAVLGSLPNDHDEYVQDFFINKVFRIDLKSLCHHAGALPGFYKQFLKDELRRIRRRSEHEVADDQGDDDETASLIEQTSELEEFQVDVFGNLKEAGLKHEEIAASASHWLASSEEWVRLAVALSYCPDADNALTMTYLAERYNINSPAYKVKKLGFNWRGSDLDGFSATLLGQWIRSLDIEIRPENQGLILGALKILCFEALSWAEQQGNAK